MAIDKIASRRESYLTKQYYYKSAREGMRDIVSKMVTSQIIDTILLPGYIGWSPKEGSGIFDPIGSIEGIRIIYYKMDANLNILVEDLLSKIQNLSAFALVMVNYFGFVDPKINTVYDAVRARSGWIIEDNAHGFFSDFTASRASADVTFFSLHKMFPFSHGGSLRIVSSKLKDLELTGSETPESDSNPWNYDLGSIMRVRRSNFEHLDKMIKSEHNQELFVPLKMDSYGDSVPQTYPVIIKTGNRDLIYERLNERGFGVVSLYHTLIEPLRVEEHIEAQWLSRRILNLPVHQDVDVTQYEEMLEKLRAACKETA